MNIVNSEFEVVFESGNQSIVIEKITWINNFFHGFSEGFPFEKNQGTEETIIFIHNCVREDNYHLSWWHGELNDENIEFANNHLNAALWRYELSLNPW